ncbi:MAG: DUF1178 family protein, partial [Geminicoccaceae bacterium]
MILFDLRCSQNHGFEAWFRDGASFERLAAAGEISCAICGDRKVEKALMAPAVRTTASLAPPPAAESGTGDKPGKESATSPSAQSGNAQSEGARSEGTVVPEDAGRHDPPDLSKMAAGPEKLMQAMHLLRQAQDHIQKNFEHVGKSFPEEA